MRRRQRVINTMLSVIEPRPAEIFSIRLAGRKRLTISGLLDRIVELQTVEWYFDSEQKRLRRTGRKLTPGETRQLDALTEILFLMCEIVDYADAAGVVENEHRAPAHPLRAAA